MNKKKKKEESKMTDENFLDFKTQSNHDTREMQ